MSPSAACRVRPGGGSAGSPPAGGYGGTVPGTLRHTASSALHGDRRGGHRGREAQLGWGTIRMYGLGCSHSPKSSLAWSLETEPAMTTSSPGFQLTGVATLYLAVSCSESMTLSTSSKFRPVVIGYTRISLIFLSGPITNTLRTV